MNELCESQSLMVVGNEKICLGMELDYVVELVRDVRITPLPCVPDYYEGICNWRGEILPVVSLQRVGELPEVEGAGCGIVIVIRVEDLECGFLIRSEPGIARINPEDRMDGKIPERIGSLIKVSRAYSDCGRIIPVIDLPDLLRNLVVYE